MRTLLALGSALLFAASAAADDSLEAIRKAFQKSEQAVTAVRCSYLSLAQLRNTSREHAPLRKRKGMFLWAASTSGKGEIEEDTETTDEAGVTWTERVVRKFDGNTQTVTHSINGVETMTNALVGSRAHVVHATSPFEMTIHFQQLALSKWLEGATVLKTEEMQGRQVSVIRIGASGISEIWLWVDVERGVAMKRVVYGDRARGLANEEQVGSDYVEIEPGVWFPNEFRRTSYGYDWFGKNRLLTRREDISVNEWAIVDK